MTDREKLLNLLMDELPEPSPWDGGIKLLLERLLANGVVVREKGEWRRVYEEGEGWVDICTRCKKIGDETDFCPNCGADMRGAVNNG